MKYVSKVKSTIKGGCDVQLSQRTVIVGPNGSGKSTIVQAIELGSNGWVSDMEGRDRVKQSKALSRLFPNEGPMFVEITVSDDYMETENSWSWSMESGPKGGFKTPVHEPPFFVRFPVQDLMATLSGDANTVGAWLEKQVLDTMTKEDLLSALPPIVREDAGKFIDRHGKTDFMYLAKTALQESKNLKSQATRQDKTVDKMTEGIAPPLTDSKLAELEAEWAEKSQQKSGVTQEQYDAYVRGVERLRTAVAEGQKALPPEAAMPDGVGQALEKIRNAKGLIRSHLDHFGVETCWVCGNDDDQAISGHVGQLNAIEGEYKPYLEAAAKRNEAMRNLNAAQTELKTKEEYLAQLTVTDGHVEREARALLQRISDDKAARRTWANADATRKETAQMRAKAERLSLVGKELKSAGERLLKKQKAAFEHRVSSFLPTDEELGVDLDASRLGLMRDGQLHSALSGAEESRVLLALASAQEDGSTPCVLIPKDRGWDRDTLGHVMAALAASPVQVVIMSTVEPDPVEGWTMVNLE
jgi:energy-coupling factor transporter ATP-binding protein EcfA2